MPSSTFNKLNSTKKANFTDACITEFGQNGYQGASISAIVKQLKMAKGSVYQYFTDKDDLYAYLVNQSLETKEELISRAHLNRSNLREWLFTYLVLEIKFAQRFSDMSRLLFDSHSPLRNQIRKREVLAVSKRLSSFKDSIIGTPLPIATAMLYAIKNELITSLQQLTIEEVVAKLDQYIGVLLNGMTKQSHEH
ncbi:MAG TPA: TetR/AcrR family transcriptional regulator [Fulvivirga sp.]|nr:TetR/AcrR family transcriptional regulator [Fulvivirga sp.]